MYAAYTRSDTSKKPKRPTHTSGVESTTICVLGASSAPDQWPDFCHLVETIFIRLFLLFTQALKSKETLSRLLSDPSRLIKTKATCTSMQLVEVNQNTLIQWYNNRQKNQELSVLLQSIQLPQTLPEPLQAAKRPRTESEQPAAAPVQATRKHSRSGKAKADFYWTTPSQTQGTSTESYVGYMLVTPSAPGASVQMLPNILYRQHQVSRMC